uniref:Uncharacterized protein n=1 Tax=Spermophilus dauricus TaxID=99837 RepID=A0A8C9PGY8_SPEDA
MSGLSGPVAQRGPCPFLLGPSSVLAISFHLPVNSCKCLHEEIHKDLLLGRGGNCRRRGLVGGSRPLGACPEGGPLVLGPSPSPAPISPP